MPTAQATHPALDRLLPPLGLQHAPPPAASPPETAEAPASTSNADVINDMRRNWLLRWLGKQGMQAVPLHNHADVAATRS
jgi:hypothetical protein